MIPPTIRRSPDRVFELKASSRAKRGGNTDDIDTIVEKAHKEAAMHHEAAAKSHHIAAEHHTKGDMASAKKRSEEAHAHAIKAQEASKVAHGKSVAKA